MRLLVATVCSVALLGCGPAAARTRTDSGITGRVLVAPTCPVERPGLTCERAYATTLAVYGRGGRARGRLVKRVQSAADGHFRVRLAPGRYTLKGTNSGLPRWTPMNVRVRMHRFTNVTFVFDSGIR